MPSYPLHLLDELDENRRAHSLRVWRTIDTRYVPSADRHQLRTAALLHDIGYAYPDTGFHPIDGAAWLARAGYSPLVCHLVATHTAAHLEAAERGLDPQIFHRYQAAGDTRAHRAALLTADLTSSPTGHPCTVTDRLEEISSRYPPGHPVARYITRWGTELENTVTHPDQPTPTLDRLPGGAPPHT